MKSKGEVRKIYSQILRVSIILCSKYAHLSVCELSPLNLRGRWKSKTRNFKLRSKEFFFA